MNIFLKAASVRTVSRVFILGPRGSFCSHELYKCTNAHKHNAHPEELGDGKYHNSKYISYFQNPDNPTKTKLCFFYLWLIFSFDRLAGQEVAEVSENQNHPHAQL